MLVENTPKEAIKISKLSIAVNLLLSAGKLAAGLLAHSGAMISDAVHSASDVFSTFVVIIGVKLSAKDSDREHPYGHERMECVAAVILSGILLATGLIIGWEGVQKILPGHGELTPPGVLAAVAALVSIVVKELLFRYVRHHARRLDSTALMAEAWHHRSDALSSIGALAGILGARAGFPILDPLASVVICVFTSAAASPTAGSRCCLTTRWPTRWWGWPVLCPAGPYCPQCSARWGAWPPLCSAAC